MKPIWKILIAAAVIVAVVAALFVIPHYRAKGAVSAYRAQLKKQGEKTTVAELTPQLSADDTSSGRELLAAAGSAGFFTNSPPMMKWLAPGHALAGWAEVISPGESTTNCWPEVSAKIKERPEITKQIAEALTKPGVGFSVQYQLGFATPLPYLSQVKKTSLWLSTAAMLAMHEKDTDAAWNNLKSETDLLVKYNGEPLMISQLVRMAMMQIALSATWEALQYPGWSEAQLAQLQTNWDSFNAVEPSGAAFSMESAMQAMAFDSMRASFNAYDQVDSDVHGGNFYNFDETAANRRQGASVFLGRFPRYWLWKWWGSYDEELYAMEIMHAAVETARTAQRGGALVPALDGFHQTVTNLQKLHPGWEGRFVFAGDLERIAASFFLKIGDAETERRMTVVAIALERYRRWRGEYPAQLEQLTPDYLSKTPIDFMDGKPLRYRRREDRSFLLYSVGEDGKDDGGDGSPLPTDISTHKQWYKMRDAVWPMPAGPDEVNKYESEMLRKVMLRKPGRLVPPMSVPQPASTNSRTN